MTRPAGPAPDPGCDPDDVAGTVHRAARAWRWVPYDAQRVEVDGRELLVRGGEARIHLADAPDAALVAAVHRRAAEAGAYAVIWVLAAPGRSTAPKCPAVLAAAGAVCVEDLELSACPLPPSPLPAEPPPGFRVRRVDTGELLDRAYDLDAEVFGTPPRSAAYRREAATALRAQLAEERATGVVGSGPCRYVVLAAAGGGGGAGAGGGAAGRESAGASPDWDIGPVVGTAGVTVVDAVARLWGAAVAPAWRRRGLFWVLLAAVLRRGTAAGATLALARARADTTAGMLRRAGFGGYGRERHYRLEI